MPKHTATHTEPAQTPIGSPDDKPEQNLATPPGCNFDTTHQVRRQNKSQLQEQFQVPGRTGMVGERGANRFTPRRSVISCSKSDVRGSRLNTAHLISWKASEKGFIVKRWVHFVCIVCSFPALYEV